MSEKTCACGAKLPFFWTGPCLICMTARGNPAFVIELEDKLAQAEARNERLEGRLRESEASLNSAGIRAHNAEVRRINAEACTREAVERARIAEEHARLAETRVRDMEGRIALTEARANEAERKWRDYEQEYILPSFQIAKKIGLDLQEAVHQSAGKNCNQLLWEHLLARSSEYERQNKELFEQGVELLAERDAERTAHAKTKEELKLAGAEAKTPKGSPEGLRMRIGALECVGTVLCSRLEETAHHSCRAEIAAWRLVLKAGQ